MLTITIAAQSLFSQVSISQVAVGARQFVETPGATRLEVAGSATPDLRAGRASLDIFGPGVIAADVYGNVYVAVRDGVFKVDPSGIRTRIAGTERNSRYSGDGGPAIRAGLNARGIAADGAGNLYLADAGSNRIRKLAAATGIVTTVAGNGVKGFSGDGGPAASAQLNGPTGVALDGSGNLYIADGTAEGNHRIRKVAAANGVITTVAGNGSQGYSGDGGPAILAQFSSLGGLATDASGNLYIADNFNNRIRMVSAATGVITTVSGNGVAGSSGDGGPAANAELNNPVSVAADTAGNLYVADSGNKRVRKIALAAGTITTIGNGKSPYPDSLHTFPCALAVDAAGNVYIADSGISGIRRVPAAIASQSVNESDAPATTLVGSLGTTNGFKINVTYDSSVPAAAQTAFDSLVNTYQSVFTNNVSVNINVSFGVTGLGESFTQEIGVSYSTWRAAMIANANANPGNVYAVAGAASLPANDPIGRGNIFLNTATARALGLTANTAVDSSLTFSNAVVFEYNGVASQGAIDFIDVAAHELDEGLGIGSALTGLADNAAIPSDDYVPEDYFRYSAAGTRAITTNPNAVVYFSYDGGNTNVAQFNQAFAALGASGLDRNDWIYGNSGCPAANPHIQDAIACFGQAVAVGSGPEITVLNALGYNSKASQTITFGLLGNVTLGVAPFSISATASSGLAVSFTSTTTAVCTGSGSTVTVIAVGTCSITASQPGNASFSPAPSVIRSFTVAAQSQPQILPAPNSKLPVGSVTFSWPAVSGADQYWLDVGSRVATGDYWGAATTVLSFAVSTVPCDGRPIYVQLWAHVGGVWQTPNRFTYTAASGCAALTSPADSSTFGSTSVPFIWTPASGADQYWLDVGNSIGKGDIHGAATTATSTTVNGIPCDGRTIFVQLWTHINGVWNNPGRYQFAAETCSQQTAQMTSPTPGSTFASTAQTFNWTTAAGATQYWLDVGTTLGQGNIHGAATTGTSATVTNIPCAGQTIFTQLWTFVNGAWISPPNRYTYTACTSSSTSGITSPVQGAVLTSPSQAFTWTAASGADQYRLDVGSQVGRGDYFSAITAALSLTATSMPCDGRTVYVQLSAHISGTWQTPQRYTYAGASGCAALASPADGTSFISTSRTFSWSAVSGADQYWLDVGNQIGVGDVFASATTGTSFNVTSLPCDGRTVYVQLWTHIGGAWKNPGRYQYTAWGACAKVTTPAPGSTLSGSTVAFSWAPGTGTAQAYWLDVGTAVAQGNIYGANVATALSHTVSGIPTAGQTIYVQLWTMIGGVWYPNRYTFTAF
jgi:hypothetical protein